MHLLRGRVVSATEEREKKVEKMAGAKASYVMSSRTEDLRTPRVSSEPNVVESRIRVERHVEPIVLLERSSSIFAEIRVRTDET